jgi:hypothetical protein
MKIDGKKISQQQEYGLVAHCFFSATKLKVLGCIPVSSFVAV